MHISRCKMTRGRKAAETRRQNDEFVRQNVAPEHLALYYRVRGKLGRGTPHQRYERFCLYLHNHPAELVQAQQSEADASLAALLAQRAEDDEWEPVSVSDPDVYLLTPAGDETMAGIPLDYCTDEI